MNPETIISKLQLAFPKAKHLLKKFWRDLNEKRGIPSTGFCYLATEVLFYKIGGLASEYKPMCVSYSKGVTHWWLQKEDKIIDPTILQFKHGSPNYAGGRCRAFSNGYQGLSKKEKALSDIAFEE